MRILSVLWLLVVACTAAGNLASQTSGDLANAIDANFDIAGFCAGVGPPWILDPLVTMANPTADFRTATRAVHTAMMNAGGTGPVAAAWTLPIGGDPTVEVIWDVDNGSFTSSIDDLIVLLTGTSGSPVTLEAEVTGENATAYVIGGDGTGSNDGAQARALVDGTSNGYGLIAAFGGWALGSGDGGVALSDGFRTTGHGTVAFAFGGDAATGTGGAADAYNAWGDADAHAGNGGVGGQANSLSDSGFALAQGGNGVTGGGDAIANG